ncbi:protein of unknown function [Shewanella benthica]|uniref:Uncharacterized protein n=1 Tax=Shewanella benthica TaxID=43661 RepID=A0A330M2A4_9GAMM|nr:hypothetical protein [Shewanella benthica]SQH76686.1 protein of unknown function [Shewanella benthica]
MALAYKFKDERCALKMLSSDWHEETVIPDLFREPAVDFALTTHVMSTAFFFPRSAISALKTQYRLIFSTK